MNLQELYDRVAIGIFTELVLEDANGLTVGQCATRALKQAEIFVAEYKLTEKPSVTEQIQISVPQKKLKGCRVCFGSGGTKANPCPICSGTGKASE